MGMHISKGYSSRSYNSSSTKLFLKKFLVTLLTKVAYRNFEISHFLNKIEFFVNMGPYGSENLKTLILHLCFFFRQPFSKMFSVTVLTKVTYWDFEILNSKFLKQIEI